MKANRKKIIIAASCLIGIIVLAVGFTTIQQNTKDQRTNAITDTQKKIASLQDTKDAFSLALTFHSQIKAAIDTAKYVRSASEIGLGVSQGWIHGCESESSDSCQTLKACNAKLDLVQWDDLDKIRSKLSSMPQSMRKDVESWLNAHKNIGTCIAEDWAGSPENVRASDDTTAILSGYNDKLSKELSDLQSKESALKTQPYFLWLSLK